MIEKTCTSCSISKPITSYHKERQGKYGVRSKCKGCIRKHTVDNAEHISERKKKWREKNAVRLKERRKQYYIDNKERLTSYQKNLSGELKEKRRIRGKAYYERTKHLQKDKRKQYYEKNKGNIRKQTTKRKKLRKDTDMVFNLKDRISSNIRHCLRVQYTNKNNNTVNILGCTKEFLHNHLCSTFELNYGIPREYIPWDEVEIDHIYPTSLVSNVESIYQLNHYLNLQLLFRDDNMNKSNKLDWKLE